MPSEPKRCPICGATFAIVVGKVGPCDPCQLEARAAHAAELERRATPRPCAAGCGQIVTGAGTYCSKACRQRAWRARRAALV